MNSKKLAVSNSGPLIHLSQIGMLRILEVYDLVIPYEVKYEVVDRGKEKGYSDAFLIEEAIENKLIKTIKVNVPDEFIKLGKLAGLHKGEISVIYYAYQKNAIALLDDSSARCFARNLGIKVRGSLGIIIEGYKRKILSYEEARKSIDKLAEVMYLSAEVYGMAIEFLKSLKSTHNTSAHTL